MPQSDRTLTLFFDPDEWHLLSVEAAKLDISVRDVVQRRVKHLLDELEIEGALEQPEEAFMALDGLVADRLGNIALERAAKERGLRFEVVGGQRHDGKKFGA